MFLENKWRKSFLPLVSLRCDYVQYETLIHIRNIGSTVIDDFVFSAKPSSQVSSITSTITFEKLYHPGMEKHDA